MPAQSTIRLMTYNIHSCVGTDRKLDPARIADVIAEAAPDIVALQEVDVGRGRTGRVDQAHMIASLLNMKASFHPALNVAEEQYGDAILTALPMKEGKSGPLPRFGEPRGALSVEVAVGERRLRVINTHLGLRGRERVQQMTALLGAGWLGHQDGEHLPTVLCGDFNAIPSSAAYRLAVRTLRDAQRAGGRAAQPTFPSAFPILRLDHIFLTEGLEADSSAVLRNRLTRRASDHLPLIADIRFASDPRR